MLPKDGRKTLLTLIQLGKICEGAQKIDFASEFWEEVSIIKVPVLCLFAK
jgi:hypothetical protein